MKLEKGTRCVPSFLKEWKQVLTEHCIKKSFSHKDLPLVKKAISHTTAAWYLGVMRDKREVKGVVSIVKHFRKALFYNPKLWKNKGAWVFFFGRLLGLQINRDGRFKKNEK